MWDGENITENPAQTESLHKILYQDAFEVVNPLGSGKKYLQCISLADWLPQHRSCIDQIQLVLYSKVRNVRLIVNFCIYCKINRNTIRTDPLCRAITHRETSFRMQIEILEDDSVQSRGINMTPCSMNCHSFIYVSLSEFKYQGMQMIDLVKFVQEVSSWRVMLYKAGACWGCCPVLNGEKIQSPVGNQTWQLVLQLREFVSLICEPAISSGQIAYLTVLIDLYLHFKRQAFPGYLLKLKHHHFSHYSDLIICFRTLVHLWIIRHTYFDHVHGNWRQSLSTICWNAVVPHRFFLSTDSNSDFGGQAEGPCQISLKLFRKLKSIG